MIAPICCLVLPPAVQDPAPPAVWFHEVGEAWLPGVTTLSGAPEKDWILEVNGGGLGLEDLDGDGDLDLLVVDGSTVERVLAGKPGEPPRLFLNAGDGRLTPAGEAWRVPGGTWGTGCALGDVDGDGWCDVVVTQWGPTRLLRNRAGAGFEERGLGDADPGGWVTSAAFLDADRDGHLDLYLTRYLAFDPARIPSRTEGDATWKGQRVMSGPEGLEPLPDVLLRGRGDGTFEDVSEAWGLRAVAPGFGLGVVTLDADGDGDTDLYVSNDSTPNHLWLWEGAGFVEAGLARGVGHDAEGREQAGMGIACGDLDGDGRPTLFVTNFSGEANALYRPSRRAGAWRERSARAGLLAPSLTRLGWGTAFLDADLDGRLDLAVLNGHVYPQADAPGTDTTYAQPDDLFVNVGGRFERRDLSDAPPGVSRALVAGDLDGDGDEDLVALQVEGPVRVLRNDAPRAGRPLVVRLVDRGSAPQALGARVTLVGAGWRRTAEVTTSGGYQAARSARVTLALPPVDGADGGEPDGAGADAGGVAPVLEVRWPDGEVERRALPDPLPAGEWRVVRGEGR